MNLHCMGIIGTIFSFVPFFDTIKSVFVFFLELSIAVKLDDSFLEKDTNCACQDEESGQEISSKPEKPKSMIRSVPKLDIVVGKKKFIALIIFSFFTLYTYVDSIVEIIPV